MFRPEQLIELKQEFLRIRPKADDLMLQLVSRQYQTIEGREHAHNGLARRIQTVARCIERVYELLPPEMVEIPERDNLYDAAINIQAAVFNVYGALDNVAFIWVFEKAVVDRNGHRLRNEKIGLFPDQKEVWASFPNDLQCELGKMADWVTNLRAFRHSLGHRIPLYIPPYCIDPFKIEEYNQLEKCLGAALRSHNFDEYSRLEKDQQKLRHYKPLMQHSLHSEKPPVVFHAQLLADFNTIEDICSKVLVALDK